MANGFNQRITRIKGLSDKRRLPRLGKIRLGIKVKKVGGSEYPKEVPYFVVPDEVKKVYGDQPTELDVMFPLDDIDTVFPVSYKFYGSSKGLKCNGDGEIAYCANETTKEMEERKCPCENLENGKCKQSGALSVMLQKINVGGIYQITTSSFNSIVDLASGIDYVKALIGRVAMVPLKLRRVATETHHDEKKQTHYTLQLVLDANIDAINQLRGDTIRVLEHTSRIVIPEVINENPELDPVDVIEEEQQVGETDIVQPGATSQATEGKTDDILTNPIAEMTKTKKPARGRDKGMAITCPEKGEKLRPKSDCNTCEKNLTCPAWE
jgi:Recombination directionality factor-like